MRGAGPILITIVESKLMDAGTRIVRSCELVENLWMQIDALGNSLIAMTESALKNNEFPSLQSAGPSTWASQISASRWNSTAYAISIPVRDKKRRKLEPTAWVNYQISVFGGGIPPSRSGDQDSIGPVVHVSFWHWKTDFKDPGMYVEFPPVWADDGEIRDERLLFWESGKDDQFSEWTFSIRLLDLNNEDALRTSIIEPIMGLLAKKETTAALPADLPGLIFYAGESVTELTASRYNKR
jgi:hypothetical protein